jgi:hypothetical protein
VLLLLLLGRQRLVWLLLLVAAVVALQQVKGVRLLQPLVDVRQPASLELRQQ